mgnify:CR=1 FL=1
MTILWYLIWLINIFNYFNRTIGEIKIEDEELKVKVERENKLKEIPRKGLANGTNGFLNGHTNWW